MDLSCFKNPPSHRLAKRKKILFRNTPLTDFPFKLTWIFFMRFGNHGEFLSKIIGTMAKNPAHGQFSLLLLLVWAFSLYYRSLPLCA